MAEGLQKQNIRVLVVCFTSGFADFLTKGYHLLLVLPLGLTKEGVFRGESDTRADLCHVLPLVNCTAFKPNVVELC